MSTSQHSEFSIKQKVIGIINTFRGIRIASADVKINQLNRNPFNEYTISGEYIYKNFFDNTIYEMGSFDITLDKNLELVSSKITPKT